MPFDEKGMPRGNFEVFADNFAGVPVVRSPGNARYRPCGLAMGPDGSLYVADSERGRVWRIIYTGASEAGATAATIPAAAQASPNLVAAALSPDAPGEKVYAAACATCHMVDGSGVANLQPALRDNPVVAGDPTQLIRIVLEGPAKVLPANRTHYSNTMPPMSQLKDDQIARVLTYIRQEYGGKASEIRPDQVATVRHRVSGDQPDSQ